jgi:hypothetical protein
MITVNGKEKVFSGFFSIKAGDEIVITPPGLDGRALRFHGVANVGDAPKLSGLEIVGNDIHLPILLLDIGHTSMENPWLGMVNAAALSGRFILQGVGAFTMVYVELFLEKLSQGELPPAA